MERGGAQRLPQAPVARRFLEGPVRRPSLKFQKGGGRTPTKNFCCREGAGDPPVIYGGLVLSPQTQLKSQRIQSYCRVT